MRSLSVKVGHVCLCGCFYSEKNMIFFLTFFPFLVFAFLVTIPGIFPISSNKRGGQSDKNTYLDVDTHEDFEQCQDRCNGSPSCQGFELREGRCHFVRSTECRTDVTTTAPVTGTTTTTTKGVVRYLADNHISSVRRYHSHLTEVQLFRCGILAQVNTILCI